MYPNLYQKQNTTKIPYRPLLELYKAIKTKKYAQDLSLFEYWIWRMYRTFLSNHEHHEI